MEHIFNLITSITITDFIIANIVALLGALFICFRRRFRKINFTTKDKGQRYEYRIYNDVKEDGEIIETENLIVVANKVSLLYSNTYVAEKHMLHILRETPAARVEITDRKAAS